MIKKVGIINSGGDAQGLNAVIASAVTAGKQKGIEFVGFIRGWEGILDKKYIDLTTEEIQGISHLGGTILGTTNKGRFAAKVGDNQVARIPQEIIDQVIANLKELDIDGLIVIGGDGTLSAAYQLVEQGVPIVGVPKSIDNDLGSTDQTFGFNTAVDIVVESLDKIHTTATAHDRIFIVETMGRNAGWIALNSGLAGGADVILVPEIKFDYAKVVERLKQRKNSKKSCTVIVVGEGAISKDEELTLKRGEAAGSMVKLAGASDRIMKRIEELAPGEFEMRNVIIGHVQRGGSPDAFDRILSKSYGTRAIQALLDGKFGEVVIFKNNKFTTAPIMEAVKTLKVMKMDDEGVVTARQLGICLGD
jgi:6-phosphofructokinase 1